MHRTVGGGYLRLRRGVDTRTTLSLSPAPTRGALLWPVVQTFIICLTPAWQDSSRLSPAPSRESEGETPPHTHITVAHGHGSPSRITCLSTVPPPHALQAISTPSRTAQAWHHRTVRCSSCKQRSSGARLTSSHRAAPTDAVASSRAPCSSSRPPG